MLLIIENSNVLHKSFMFKIVCLYLKRFVVNKGKRYVCFLRQSVSQSVTIHIFTSDYEYKRGKIN